MAKAKANGCGIGNVNVLLTALLTLLAGLAWLGLDKNMQKKLFGSLDQKQRELLFEE